MRRGGVQTTPTQACRFPARMLRARRGYDPPKRDPTCFSWHPKSVQQRRKGALLQWTLLGQSSTWTWVSMQLSGQFFVETRTRQNFTSLPMPPGQHQQGLLQVKKPPSFPTMRGIPHLVAPKTGHCPPNLPQIWYSSYQLQLSTREHFRFCCSLMIFYIQKNLPPLVSPTSAV